MDSVLDEELQVHLDLFVEQNLQRGMTPEEARRAAKLALGGADQIKESVRDQRGLPLLESFWLDVRYGARMLRKSSGFTAVAVLTLALGIGANTAIFSLIDALLLRSLPVRDPQQLMLLQWSARKSPGYHHSSLGWDCVERLGADNATSCGFSHPFFDELRSQTKVFSSITASGGYMDLDLSGNGPTSFIQGLIVSGNYFDALGVRPAIGRVLEPSDDQPRASAVAV